ncbi:LysE family translocator [Rodentibacter trehalosifermentans]|uniref:MFS transporter n=1 Tax=Rodentibacter trehalosifermentans TaxID=1908263 RepID=A0A1V3J4Q8_9PAST|nr:LysE family transporter [Rodentibacter trehalosifermentans]OOF45916.1 MFS transporter [Rodentibacter trehalosifermentans]OOF50169.1 MFS transporter [Rodentibacter trehalosifermentans]OOF52969.1 MFS transporter [Rodentibacter trehalosifermentans]
MDFWQGFFIITSIHILAAISPGPDFIYVSQQTLSRGRKAGLICALGVGLGFGIHILYSILGLAAVIASASWLLTLIKVLGGTYLVYLGYQGLKAKAKKEVVEISKVEAKPESALHTLWKGVLCNVLNPKAPVYLVSVFTVVLSPDMPIWQLSVYGGWMMFLLFLWFAGVAFLLSIPSVNSQFQRAGHWIDRILGGLMVGLGIKVISS